MFLILLLIGSTNVLASEHPAWSYEGESSPEHWGDISSEFNLCKNGMNQSPVNITNTQKIHTKPLQLTFSQVSVTEINNGHTLQVNDNGGDIFTLDSEKFTLQQFHFHTPSENTIEGNSFPMEAHFVHKNEDGEIAVIAVMYKVGAENIELKKLLQSSPKEEGKEANLGQILTLKNLFPADLSYYRFTGSLTTPPCLEGVRWLVLKHPITASAQQIKQFADMMHHHNNRPVQPLHGRTIIE
ncbi:carbonic anhydrase [Neisseria sp. Ec49-e6-T10]|uniref:carbonic anhydrase n=1 Tax=Neisseria sp. Ec49-e6-T10 TaxID=3140744 RepID=UPI003EBA2BE0